MSTKEIRKVKSFKTYDSPYQFICNQKLEDLSIFQIHELHLTQKFLILGLRLKKGWFSWSMFTRNIWN